MNFIKRYYLTAIFILCSTVYSDDDHIIYYGLNEGPNLVSFPIISEDNDLNLFFTDSNSSLISNNNISQSFNAIISEGEFGILSNSAWNGSLDQISGNNGYWILAEEQTNFMIIGQALNDNLFFLHPGANLISYPFSASQDATNALSFLSSNIYAVIGQNEALLSIDGTWWGSLTEFSPGKGYWFIVNSYTPFQYTSVLEGDASINLNHNILDNEYNESFNQSTLQSVHFIEKIYISGHENESDLILEVTCDEVVVGSRNWHGNYSDIIAMGNDSFGQTDDYCENNDLISIRSQNSEIDFHILSGEEYWSPNNFSINILSDSRLGDLNYNNMLNVSDVIIMIEYLLNSSESFNNHQLLLSDLNQDESINITDVIINIENILEN